MAVGHDAGRRSHPVWAIYDEHRTARLNVKYYSVKRQRMAGRSLTVDLIIAVATSTSIAGLTVLKSELGQVVWPWVGALGAFCAVIKPIMRWPDRLFTLQEIVSGYRILDHDLAAIGRAVADRQAYDAEIRRRFDAAQERKRELVRREDGWPVDQALRKRCQTEVQRELPIDSFFIPRDAS